MSRSVVAQGAPRCPRCRLTVRWCVCPALGEPVDVPVAVDVVQHSDEAKKPTSSTHLIARLVGGARVHVRDPREAFDPAALLRPGHETWLLHPKGEDWPAERPAKLQLLLFDGTWMQAGEMLRLFDRRGRRVRLAIGGASRFWLRTQHEPGNVSTMEALLAALGACGADAARARLNVAFEVQVYGALRSRGKKALALEYRASSPVRAELEARLALLPYGRADAAELDGPGAATGGR